MITFIVQNETHALNFEPIIQELLSLGVPNKHLQTIHLDKIYGLSTYDLISVPNKKIIELDIPHPYYRLNPFKRFLWMFKAKNHLREHVKDTQVLIFGSDGGVQRLLANFVRSQGGKIILLVDGLLHPWPENRKRKHILKRDINNLLCRFSLNHFFPADIGHSNLDFIYVMHTVIKDILLDQGVETPISVVTLPRYEKYTREYHNLREPKFKTNTNKCLYATSAFKWHGLYTKAQQQQQDIADLVCFSKKNPNWEIRVRIHPREILSDYISQDWPCNMELSTGASPVQQDLAWASVVITSYSTIAYEAELVGIPVLIYTKNFGPPHRKSFFAKNPYFYQSDNLEDIIRIQQKPHRVRFLQSSAKQIALKIKYLYDN